MGFIVYVISLEDSENLQKSLGLLLLFLPFLLIFIVLLSQVQLVRAAGEQCTAGAEHTPVGRVLMALQHTHTEG